MLSSPPRYFFKNTVSFFLAPHLHDEASRALISATELVQKVLQLIRIKNELNEAVRNFRLPQAKERKTGTSLTIFVSSLPLGLQISRQTHPLHRLHVSSHA